jgi:protein-tyrosine phosphatase
MEPWASEPGMVVFPDERRVRGVSVGDQRFSTPQPEFAVYLLAHEPRATQWEREWIRWPDFRTPTSTDNAIDVLLRAREVSANRRVDISCSGGVGRTGTAIAFLAAVSGVDVAHAVEWTRENYHLRAVETPWQRRWVRDAYARYLERPG